MSQQAAAGRGTPAAGCGRKAGRIFRRRGDPPIKGFISVISKIANNTLTWGKINLLPNLCSCKEM
jgi:hypothetical protein